MDPFIKIQSKLSFVRLQDILIFVDPNQMMEGMIKEMDKFDKYRFQNFFEFSREQNLGRKCLTRYINIKFQ